MDHKERMEDQGKMELLDLPAHQVLLDLLAMMDMLLKLEHQECKESKEYLDCQDQGDLSG